MNMDNQPVKKGFIWVQESDSVTDTPDAYKVARFGGIGVYHRVDDTHPNGGEPVSWNEYQKAEVEMW